MSDSWKYGGGTTVSLCTPSNSTASSSCSTSPDWSTKTCLPTSSTGGTSKPHERYYFDDGNVILLVENVLYKIHMYFLKRDSVYFANRLAMMAAWNTFSPFTVALPDVTVSEFDAFLSILYPSNFDELDISSLADWTSVLRLAAMWGFTSIVNRAIRHLDTLTSPLDKLVLARAHRVERWVVPALVALCERLECLNLEDVRRMTLEDIVLVGRLRESVRDDALKVCPEEVRAQVEAAVRESSPLAESKAAPAMDQSLLRLDANTLPAREWTRTITRPPKSHLSVLESGDVVVPQKARWGSRWGKKYRGECERDLAQDNQGYM